MRIALGLRSIAFSRNSTPLIAGQHLVRDDQRDVLALEDREPVFAALGREDAVVGAERQLEGFEDGGLVVDDQDAVGALAGRSARPFDRRGSSFFALAHDCVIDLVATVAITWATGYQPRGGSPKAGPGWRARCCAGAIAGPASESPARLSRIA